MLVTCVQYKGRLWFLSKVLMCVLACLWSAYELTGLSRGGQQVQRCKEVFGKAIKLLVELASLQVRKEWEGMGEKEGGERALRSPSFSMPLIIFVDLLCDSG